MRAGNEQTLLVPFYLISKKVETQKSERHGAPRSHIQKYKNFSLNFPYIA